MIDYSKVKPGDKLRITGMGAPGFAKLGDIVTVKACTSDNLGRCDVVHDETGEEAYFALTCGANRLEPTHTEMGADAIARDLEWSVEHGVDAPLADIRSAITTLRTQQEEIERLSIAQEFERERGAALLKANADLERLRGALEPFANAVYNDNGDMTVSTSHLKPEHYKAAYFARRAAALKETT